MKIKEIKSPISNLSSLKSECPIYSLSDAMKLGHQLTEAVWFQRLSAVGDSRFRMAMNFDNQTIGPGGHSGQRAEASRAAQEEVVEAVLIRDSR